MTDTNNGRSGIMRVALLACVVGMVILGILNVILFDRFARLDYRMNENYDDLSMNRKRIEYLESGVLESEVIVDEENIYQVADRETLLFDEEFETRPGVLSIEIDSSSSTTYIRFHFGDIGSSVQGDFTETVGQSGHLSFWLWSRYVAMYVGNSDPDDATYTVTVTYAYW